MKKDVAGVLTVLFLMVVIMLPSVSAITRTGHITLLAVFEEGNEFRGSPADITLQIEDGSGRVFLETIPLSKVDTQISTRFAKEIACNFAEVDCDKYDFFYTIRSEAGIVGGPSAGAAIAALTVSMLKDYPMEEHVAITGTINSGEVIGPVGSLAKKIDAAKDVEIKKVIVPSTPATASEDNLTGVINYGNEVGIEVVPVAMLSETVTQLTGVEFEETNSEIKVPETYQKTMKQVAQELCDRSEELIAEAPIIEKGMEEGSINLDWVQEQKNALNMTAKGEEAFENKNYYSAASYCFGANIKASTLIYKLKKLDNRSATDEAALILDQIENFDKITEKRSKETITDLQTYMIVKERILESQEYLEKSSNDSDALGYSTERLNSAKIWSVFFGQGGTKYQLDDESLKSSCVQTLGEVEERFQYLNLFFPGLLTDLRNNLLMAGEYHKQGEYAMCIYLAKRTKAEADIMVSLLGVSEEAAQEMLTQKADAARRAINKQIEKGIFPIIAYSYYEYATSLMGENDYAAIIYAEYALELSDIDIYFEKHNDIYIRETLKKVLKTYAPTILFIWGVFIGYLLCYVVKRDKEKTANTKKKTVKKKKKVRKSTRTKLTLR